MGTVWLAERADGLMQRHVALKLPRGAWLRADLVARMGRERDILSTLEHPNIARLYDAGVTAGGRPFLALEFVDGRSIDQYFAAEGLDVRARVRLFLQVVQAVAYAHGRLVVHRDLKPSNILVTRDGQVRLLDFGIAKLLDEGHDRQPGLTELAGRPHTPEYASPEQISGELLSTASDIYSLGVVLYELSPARVLTRSAELQRRARGRHPRDRSGPAERVGAGAVAAQGACAEIWTRLFSRRSGRSRPNAMRRRTRSATICGAGSRGCRSSRAPTARGIACRSSSGAMRLPSPRRQSSSRALRRSASCRRGRRACWPSSGELRKSSGTRPSRWCAY